MSDVSTVLSLSGHVASVIARGVFAGALGAAMIADVRARRIPNVLCVTLAFAGLAAAALRLSWAAGLGGAAASLAVGFALWLPGYVLGWVGAGDVKLFAAASAWLTPAGACWAALAGALVGAAVAVASYVWAHGATFAALRLGNALRDPVVLAQPVPSARGRDARVPYAVSLVAGVMLQAFIPGWHAWLR